MKNKKVVSYKSLPSKSPLIPSLVMYLMLDHFDASGVVQGVAWTLMSIVWIGSIIQLFTQEQIDVLDR